MGTIARRLLRGAVLLVAGAVFSFAGFLIGHELRGSPAAPLALAVAVFSFIRYHKEHAYG